MGIVNNGPKQDEEVKVVEEVVESPEVLALKAERDVAKARVKELESKIEEVTKSYKDKLIEVYEQANKKEEPEDNRTELEKLIAKSIAMLNNGKKRKNI